MNDPLITTVYLAAITLDDSLTFSAVGDSEDAARASLRRTASVYLSIWGAAPNGLDGMIAETKVSRAHRIGDGIVAPR